MVQIEQREYRYVDHDRPATYADTWWSGEAIVATVHLNAGNDFNGNPRRVYVGLNAGGGIVAVADEGYSGRPDWLPDALNAPMFPTSASEYRDRVATIEHHRGLYGVCRVLDGSEGRGERGTIEVDPYARGWTRQRAQRLARAQYTWCETRVMECGIAAGAGAGANT